MPQKNGGGGGNPYRPYLLDELKNWWMGGRKNIHTHTIDQAINGSAVWVEIIDLWW